MNDALNYRSAVREFDRMLKCLNLDTEDTPFKPITRIILFLNCTDCSQRQACRRWLSESDDKNGYRQFCPNAQTFDHLLQRDRWRGLRRDLNDAPSPF
jgi:hypothetical protein